MSRVIRMWVPSLTAVLALGLLTLSGLSCSKSSSDTRTGRKPPTYKGPKVELKTKFSPGWYDLTEAMDISMTMRAQGDKMVMKMPFTIGGDVEIGAPDASGDQEVKFTCRRIKMEATMEGGPRVPPMKYDSQGPPEDQNPELARTMRPFVGWGCTLTGRDGKWTKVPDTVELMAQAVGPAGARDQQSEKMAKQMSEFAKELFLKHWGELLPQTPVGPGDSWKGTMKVESMPIFGKANFDCQCECRDIEETPAGKLAVLAIQATVNLGTRTVDPADFGGPGGGKVTIDKMQATVSGTGRFNLDIGLGTELELVEQLDGAMKATDPSGKEQEMNLSAKITYHNTLVKGEKPKRPAPAASGDTKTPPTPSKKD